MAAEETSLESRKRLAAVASLLYNASLTVLKMVAALSTGSVSLLSEAVHSATDVVASSFAYVGVRIASAPPDEEHPYGHGKVESLAGFGESILLFLIVLYILAESIQKLLGGSSVKNLDIGLWIMGFSAVGSLLLGHFVSKIGRESNSIALRSNGQHLIVDFWTSLGVMAALATTKLTKWEQADAVFAIGLALWIAYGSFKMGREAVDQLIDRKMPEDEVERIVAILKGDRDCLSFHRLRTRHSGSEHYIDVHIVVPNDWSLVKAHEVADHLEKTIAAELHPAHVVIHVDPFDAKKLK
jgi:cation diffusion facilitator family transporter